MSLELVINALVSLGLTRIDAEVYVYIAKKGSQTVKKLVMALNYSKNQIYSSIKELTIRGLVTKRGMLFSALPFEETLELLIELNKEKAQCLQDSIKELIASWEIK